MAASGAGAALGIAIDDGEGEGSMGVGASSGLASGTSTASGTSKASNPAGSAGDVSKDSVERSLVNVGRLVEGSLDSLSGVVDAGLDELTPLRPEGTSKPSDVSTTLEFIGSLEKVLFRVGAGDSYQRSRRLGALLRGT